MIKEGITERNVGTLLAFSSRLGVPRDHFLSESQGDNSKTPLIITKSESVTVQELIKEVNFQREMIKKLNDQLEVKEQQLERKEKQLDAFIEKFVKN